MITNHLFLCGFIEYLLPILVSSFLLVYSSFERIIFIFHPNYCLVQCNRNLHISLFVGLYDFTTVTFLLLLGVEGCFLVLFFQRAHLLITAFYGFLLNIRNM